VRGWFPLPSMAGRQKRAEHAFVERLRKHEASEKQDKSSTKDRVRTASEHSKHSVKACSPAPRAVASRVNCSHEARCTPRKAPRSPEMSMRTPLRPSPMKCGGASSATALKAAASSAALAVLSAQHNVPTPVRAKPQARSPTRVAGLPPRSPALTSPPMRHVPSVPALIEPTRLRVPLVHSASLDNVGPPSEVRVEGAGWSMRVGGAAPVLPREASEEVRVEGSGWCFTIATPPRESRCCESRASFSRGQSPEETRTHRANESQSPPITWIQNALSEYLNADRPSDVGRHEPDRVRVPCVNLEETIFSEVRKVPVDTHSSDLAAVNIKNETGCDVTGNEETSCIADTVVATESACEVLAYQPLVSTLSRLKSAAEQVTVRGVVDFRAELDSLVDSAHGRLLKVPPRKLEVCAAAVLCVVSLCGSRGDDDSHGSHELPLTPETWANVQRFTSTPGAFLSALRKPLVADGSIAQGSAVNAARACLVDYKNLECNTDRSEDPHPVLASQLRLWLEVAIQHLDTVPRMSSEPKCAVADALEVHLRSGTQHMAMFEVFTPPRSNKSVSSDATSDFDAAGLGYLLDFRAEDVCASSKDCTLDDMFNGDWQLETDVADVPSNSECCKPPQQNSLFTSKQTSLFPAQPTNLFPPQKASLFPAQQTSLFPDIRSRSEVSLAPEAEEAEDTQTRNKSVSPQEISECLCTDMNAVPTSSLLLEEVRPDSEGTLPLASNSLFQDLRSKFEGCASPVEEVAVDRGSSCQDCDPPQHIFESRSPGTEASAEVQSLAEELGSKSEGLPLAQQSSLFQDVRSKSEGSVDAPEGHAEEETSMCKESVSRERSSDPIQDRTAVLKLQTSAEDALSALQGVSPPKQGSPLQDVRSSSSPPLQVRECLYQHVIAEPEVLAHVEEVSAESQCSLPEKRHSLLQVDGLVGPTERRSQSTPQGCQPPLRETDAQHTRESSSPVADTSSEVQSLAEDGRCKSEGLRQSSVVQDVRSESEGCIAAAEDQAEEHSSVLMESNAKEYSRSPIQDCSAPTELPTAVEDVPSESQGVPSPQQSSSLFPEIRSRSEAGAAPQHVQTLCCQGADLESHVELQSVCDAPRDTSRCILHIHPSQLEGVTSPCGKTVLAQPQPEVPTGTQCLNGGTSEDISSTVQVFQAPHSDVKSDVCVAHVQTEEDGDDHRVGLQDETEKHAVIMQVSVLHEVDFAEKLRWWETQLCDKHENARNRDTPRRSSSAGPASEAKTTTTLIKPAFVASRQIPVTAPVTTPRRTAAAPETVRETCQGALTGASPHPGEAHAAVLHPETLTVARHDVQVAASTSRTVAPSTGTSVDMKPDQRASESVVRPRPPQVVWRSSGIENMCVPAFSAANQAYRRFGSQRTGGTTRPVNAKGTGSAAKWIDITKGALCFSVGTTCLMLAVIELAWRLAPAPDVYF